MRRYAAGLLFGSPLSMGPRWSTFRLMVASPPGTVLPGQGDVTAYQSTTTADRREAAMHDDIPLTVGRATRVLEERILPAVHAVTVPVTVEWHELPGEPVPAAQGLVLEDSPYEVGTPWGAAWGTTWF